MIELLTDPAIWMSFATLTVLEIVLGIDNIIFISILSSRLPKIKQKQARQTQEQNTAQAAVVQHQRNTIISPTTEQKQKDQIEHDEQASVHVHIRQGMDHPTCIKRLERDGPKISHSVQPGKAGQTESFVFTLNTS